MAHYRQYKRNAPALRPIEFWEGLKGLGFIPHVEWYNNYMKLDEARDRLAAVTKLLEYGLPKPKIEDFEKEDNQPKIEMSYDLLKRVIEAEVKQECHPKQSQHSLESQPPSSPSELVKALTAQESKA